ncbi:MAG: DUF3794 domain-containing protein [Oscillospiraceae bacterium]
MEFGLQKTQLTGYHAILNTTVSHEETMEAIVPDACPDILRIIDTQAMAGITAKEPFSGRVELSGTAKVTALYLPDGGEGVRKLELTMPFRCMVEGPAVEPGAAVVATVEVRGADTRCLNPRKVLARLDLQLWVTVFAAKQASFCTGFSGAEGLGLQKRETVQGSYMITAVQEKTFTFSDDLSFLPGHPAAEELLRYRLDARCPEAKVIGNKLIFKGQTFLQALYRTETGGLATCRWELPFSQIMEVKGVEEEADCTVYMTVEGCTLSLATDSAGEARAVNVSMELTAQAVVREERPIRLISDAYCTNCPLTAVREPCCFKRRMQENSVQQSVREVLEVAVAAKAVEDCTIALGGSALRREGENGVLSAESFVTVLYRGEDDGLYSVTRQLPVSYRLALPSGCDCQTRCFCEGEPQATPTMGGIEVRYAVSFQYLVEQDHHAVILTDARCEEEQRREPGEQPSLVLRVVQGEQLWDLAKAYRAAVPDMMAANSLESEELSDGMLLLIPQKK